LLTTCTVYSVYSLILFPIIATGGNDTGGKFATGVNETSSTGVLLIPVENLPSLLLTPVKNLPPVSLILGLHLDLRIYLRIFEKNLNDPKVIFRGLGEDVSRKNRKK
jgi:hypothetical protein